MSRIDHLVARCEELYRSVVSHPEEWAEHRFAEWAEEVTLDGERLDKPSLKQVRAVMRSARKMQSFWTQNLIRPEDHGDWRSRVDIALGPRAWRPVLELAMHGLDTVPTPELYSTVQRLFPVVNTQRWMEDASYDDWLAQR